jgi:hypothetical protein
MRWCTPTIFGDDEWRRFGNVFAFAGCRWREAIPCSLVTPSPEPENALRMGDNRVAGLLLDMRGDVGDNRRAMDEVFGLFATPFLRARGTFGPPLVARLIEYFTARATRDNSSSDKLAHTEMLRPNDSPLLVEAAGLIAPKLVDFGTHLFGERLPWLLKEMWVNVLDTGGRQAMHNHANSFISGVVYLTRTHPSSQTVFMKSPGGTDFLFKNDHQGMTPNEYCADKWISPAPDPGDLVLFPSYLMHAVPPNQGERRITLSFNAIPSQLNSWGYVVRFVG